MPKIYICIPLSDSKTLSEVASLASNCECDVQIVDGSKADGIIAGQLVDCDGVLVVLKQPLSELNAIEPTILLANKQGKKIICIWPPKSKSEILPQILEKYGTALLQWDSSKLCAAICDDDLEWADAGGGKRVGSATKRHKC